MSENIIFYRMKNGPIKKHRNGVFYEKKICCLNDADFYDNYCAAAAKTKVRPKIPIFRALNFSIREIAAELYEKWYTVNSAKEFM